MFAHPLCQSKERLNKQQAPGVTKRLQLAWHYSYIFSHLAGAFIQLLIIMTFSFVEMFLQSHVKLQKLEASNKYNFLPIKLCFINVYTYRLIM